MLVTEIIEKINYLKAEADNYPAFSEDNECQLWDKFRISMNFHSNRLEGNSLTFNETKALLMNGTTASGKPLKDHLEIRCHDTAIKKMCEMLKREKKDLDEDLIKEFHKWIYEETFHIEKINPKGSSEQHYINPGKFKTKPNNIRTITGEMIYYASPEETPANMAELIEWLSHAIKEAKEHPLIIASIFLFRFNRIQPFDIGSGKVGRLAINYILISLGYPPIIINSEKKDEYYSALLLAHSSDVDILTRFLGERLISSFELKRKAARNEPLNEPEDIDNMVAALKKKIEWTPPPHVEVQPVKSRDVLLDLYNNFIYIIFDKFIREFSKLNMFFSDFEIIFRLNKAPYRNTKDWHTYFFNNFSEKNKKIESVGIEYKLKNLLSNQDISIDKRIDLNFAQNSYYISYYSTRQVSMKNAYNQVIYDYEINQIVSAIFASAFNIINANIDVAIGKYKKGIK